MNHREDYGILVVFTALAPLTVGGLVGLLVARGLVQEPGIDWAAIFVFIAGILALIVSLLHLGRPWRAPLALLHLATSWLSREVVLFGLFLLFLGCYAFLPAFASDGLVGKVVGVTGAVIGLLSTVATGKTYHLHACPSWDQWLTIVTFPLGALSTGTLFGFFMARQYDPHLHVTGFVWVAIAMLLAFSLVVTWLRSIRLPLTTTEANLSRQLVMESYLWSLILRMAAAILAIILIWIGGWQQFFAWIPAMIGDFADRILFFKAAVPIALKRRFI